MEDLVRRQSALVLGGRGGIGAQIVAFLSESGWAVSVAGRGERWVSDTSVIINAAGAGMSSQSRGDLATLRAANVEPAIRAGRLASDTGARLVHIGTALQRSPMTSDLYVKTKSEASAQLRHMPGLDLVELWPHLVVGTPGSLVTRIARSLVQGVPFALRTPRARRDIVHVHDVARAVLAAATATASVVEPLEIGTGRGVSMANLVTMVGEIIGAEAGWIEQPTPTPSWDGDLIAETTRARETLGFVSSICPEEALRRVLFQFVEVRLA